MQDESPFRVALEVNIYVDGSDTSRHRRMSWVDECPRYTRSWVHVVHRLQWARRGDRPVPPTMHDQFNDRGVNPPGSTIADDPC